MKRHIALLLSLLLAGSVFSASINKSLIPVRTDLFNSQEELNRFDFKQELSKDENEFYNSVEFYLLIGGPGSLVWENFGHSAFICKMPDGDKISFDYGMFSFNEGFYKNFALGRLYYSVMESYAKYRVASLEADDRTIEYLPLILTNTEKRNLLAFLEYNARDDNKTYLYNYYYDNCATRLRDAYNAITDNDFKSWASNIKSEETLRAYSKRYLSRSSFPVAWAINYLLGPKVDLPITLWEAMFLPDVLNEAISDYQGNESEIIYQSKSRAETPDKYNFFLYSIILVLFISLPILLTKSSKRYLRRIGDILSAIILFILGAMSLVLLFLMTASIHDVTYLNTNVIILSPLLLVLSLLHCIALGKKERRKGIKNISLVLLLLTISMFIMKIIFMEFCIQENIEYYILALAIYASEFIKTRSNRKN